MKHAIRFNFLWTLHADSQPPCLLQLFHATMSRQWCCEHASASFSQGTRHDRIQVPASRGSWGQGRAFQDVLHHPRHLLKDNTRGKLCYNGPLEQRLVNAIASQHPLPWNWACQEFLRMNQTLYEDMQDPVMPKELKCVEVFENFKAPFSV